MSKSLWTYSPSLHPDELSDLDAGERKIANAIRSSTERAREAERAKEPKQGIPMGLLGILGSPAAGIAWEVLLQNLDVVRQASEEAGVSQGEVVRVARDKCRPRHWRSLMWFSFNVELLERLRPSATEDMRDAVVRHQLAIEAKVRKATASSGGLARSEPYKEPKEFVQSEWALHKDAYDNNKSSFARSYARLVKQQFGIEVTERTLRESWLKDIQ